MSEIQRLKKFSAFTPVIRAGYARQEDPRAGCVSLVPDGGMMEQRMMMDSHPARCCWLYLAATLAVAPLSGRDA